MDELIMLNKIFNKYRVPDEIERLIISYTYQLQNKDLLYDVQNYYTTKTYINKFYYDHEINCIKKYNPHELGAELMLLDKFWLMNDIIRFFNNYQSTRDGYIEGFLNLFRCNPMLKTNLQIENYFSQIILKKNNKIAQVNLMWGLLRHDDRDAFIQNCVNSLD
jgi:hypothetical protein